ncbi:MAG: RagB/SusD family nutrient uptake outer membrane protein, partial [Clostridium sp.]|nr:RagB/SusD family nutrient uptake outer membrane protein [Clostridium sp.]
TLDSYFLHNLPEGGWRITMETVKALRAEIALSLGYNDEAGYLLRDCQSDFSIAVEESSEPEMYRVFGESLANYTPAKTALLLKEAGMEDTADKSALPDEWKTRKQDWGYWIMLKRTGQAQAVAGCEAYELLMPFPQSEINLLPALTQNPGY